MFIKGKTPFIHDIESFPNFFSDAVVNANSNNIKVFEISSRKNDILDIIKLYSNIFNYYQKQIRQKFMNL